MWQAWLFKKWTWVVTALGNMDKWLLLETWTRTTLGYGPWLHLGTWTMTTLGDMDHDYTWEHGQMTALGDMDHDYIRGYGPWLHWDMDHDYTWGHGPWLHWDMDHDYTWGHGQVTALGDMDHDYTWGHGPWLHLELWTMTTLGDTVTTLGDMDHGTSWGMDHDHTWGHRLGVWLHLIWAVSEKIFFNGKVFQSEITKVSHCECDSIINLGQGYQNGHCLALLPQATGWPNTYSSVTV